MKRLIALFLALMMVLSLAGCADVALLGLDIAAEVLAGDDTSYDTVSDEETLPQITEAQITDESEPAQTDIPEESTYVAEATEPEETEAAPEETEAPLIDEDGWYYSVEDVSLYLYTYGHLPENFITKNDARDLGWEGGSVEKFAPGFAIGGDKFGNREGLLPSAPGRTYYECDIDTNGENSRGAKRIVFSNDGLIYYTDDHYESFTLLYGEE